MSTTEKLFVQLFDQKRHIIEELKHQKQLYDKYLLSKLLIQDISPPHWLLNFDSQSSTSDLNGFNKEVLLKGLLLPRPGPFASYPTGPCLLYEKPPIAAANSGILSETCAVKSASSNGIDEDEPGVAPLCQVDSTEDMAGIASMCHADGTGNMARIAPMCQVDGAEDAAGIAPICQADGTEGTAGIVPMCQVAGTENTAGIAPTCQVDGTEVTASIAPSCQVDGTEDLACIVPPCQFDGTEEKVGIAPMCQVDGTEDKAGIASTCQVGGAEDTAGIAPMCQVGGTVDTADIAPPSHVDGTPDTSGYVPMSPEDQTDTRLSNACQPDQSHARLHRSRSRQKAMELRNSAKTSAKSRLGMDNNVLILSGSKTCRYDEQLDGLKGSLELAELSELPTNLCSNEEVSIGDSLNNERSGDACGIFLAQSSGSLAKELKSGVSEVEKNSSVYGCRVTRSISSSQQLISSHSGSELYRFDKIFDGSSGSLELDERSRLPTEICFKEQGASEILSDKERSFDACKASLSCSTINEDKEVYIRVSQKIEEQSNNCGNRSARSRSSCQQSVGGAPLFENMSDKVYVGRITRSRSGKAQHSETGMGNSKAYSVTRSRSSSQLSVGEPFALEKKTNEACVDRLTNSRIGKTQLTEIAMENSKACSGKITRSRSCEAEPSNMRSMDRKESVEPKQLDFDEVEETSLCNVPFQLPDKRPSSSSLVKDFSDVNLPKLLPELSMLPDFNLSHPLDGSWPKYKRRKIEYQNPNKSASPTLRANPFQAFNENLPSRSAQAEKESILLPSLQSTNSDRSVATLSDHFFLMEENDQNITSHNKEHVLTPQIQCDKYKVSSGRSMVTSSCEHLQLSKYDGSNARQSIISEPSDSLPEDGDVKEKQPSAVLLSGKVSDGLFNGQGVVDNDTAAKLICTEGAADQTKSPQRVDGFKFSIGSLPMGYMNITEADQAIPEFEGFVIGEAQNSQDELVHKDFSFPSSIMDRASLPEQISNSASLSTPVSPFHTACKMYLAPGMYSSVPNGLLENNVVRSNLLRSGSALLGKSHSDLFSFPVSQYGWDNRKPFFSPMGKSSDSITSKSGGSDKLRNSNLELTCFPILEDPESSEEDVNGNPGVQGFESTMNNIANNKLLLDLTVQCENSMDPDDAIESVGLESVTTEVRKNNLSTSDNKVPFSDMTMQNQSTLALDHAIERRSQGSVSTKVSILEINDSKKSSMGQSRSRHIRPGKENKGVSVAAIDNSSKKHSKTLSNRFSKPKLSGQSSLRTRGQSRGQSVSEKVQKHNNIVSGVKSFLPLVQQKQAAAAVPEKRDVKVKALQAAEAAKRAADKRENERNQKKEALKLERVRVEQEKMKEAELKKKMKEEQRKKREVENAAKKRQREEEERKEKERKKRHIEDARLQQKQAEEKLHTWKEELSYAAEDERAYQQKDSDEKTEKKFDKENEGDSGKPLNDSVVVGNNQSEANVGLPAFVDDKTSAVLSATGKMCKVDMAESSTPNFDKIDKPTTQANESYDLSPYRDSDDEEEEEEDMPNKKFVPSWASKTCVISALLSLQHLDPDVIFPLGSFCSMDEVLMPRRLLQK